jgi:hypothetical protein
MDLMSGECRSLVWPTPVLAIDLRLCVPGMSELGGLTMSLKGGFEGFEEFFCVPLFWLPACFPVPKYTDLCPEQFDFRISLLLGTV